MHPFPRPNYEEVWPQLHPLISEHHLWTVLWGVLVLCMIVGAYKKLRSISPVLAPLGLCLLLFIMLLVWAQTRGEPKFLSPLVDLVTRLLPGTPAQAAVPNS